MSSETPTAWQSRPILAGLTRAFVFVAPIVLSILAVVVVSKIVPRPVGLLRTVAWWVGLTVVSTVVLWSVDRFLRKLMPVVALFKLSLVFPDRAPSRFKTALKSGTVRQLERQMEAGKLSDVTPQDAAELLIRLASVMNDHDRLTRGHTERVRAYSVMIGEELGLDKTDLEFLNWAGLVHDIGKLWVPPDILSKNGKPTDDEWKILRDHPTHGDRLIQPLRPWLGEWAEAATQHHERYDGKGYPNGLAGRDITLAGRIVAVADAYDVMTSVRSYKKAMPAEVARKELAANSGTQFDPEVVRAFLNVAIGRLRLVMGPLSSLVQFPAGSASLGSAAVTTVGTGTAMAVASVFGMVGEPVLPEPIPEVTAFVDAEAPDAEFDGVEDEIVMIDLAQVVAAGDPALDPLSFALVGMPAHGTAELVDVSWVRFVPDDDASGLVTITYEVCFSDGTCDEGVLTINLGPVNDRPEATDDTITISEDGSGVVDVLANDLDVDGDTLIITSVSVDWPDHDPDQLSVFQTTGGLDLTPAADQWGTATISYQIADPDGLTAEAQVAVEILPVNDAPIAGDDRATVLKNTARTIDVLGNDADVDGDTLTITSLTSVAGGSATNHGENITFTPTTDYVGPASLSYTVSDGSGGVDTARVDLVVSPTGPVLDLMDDSAGTNEDTTLVIDVLANDVSIGSTFDLGSLSIVTAPAIGTATVSTGSIRYTPAANWSGTTTFAYGVCDVVGTCANATVLVTVAPVNDPPIAAADAGPGFTTTEDTPFTTGNVTTNDTDIDNPVNPATTTIVSGPANGALINNTNGTFTYTPDPDWSGTDTFTYTITDPAPLTSNPATVTIVVTPVNDPPVANDDSGIGFTTTEDTPFTTGNVTTNDTDIDNPVNPATTTIVSGPANGALINNTNGTFTYTPDPNWSGTDTFTYTITDPAPLTSNPATVTIVVTPVNDPPVANDDSGIGFTTTEDTPFTTGNVTTNDTDIDNPVNPATTTIVSGPANGALINNTNGTFTYTPDPNWSGTDTFTYTITDPAPLTSNPATVTIVVSATGDPPTLDLNSGQSVLPLGTVTIRPIDLAASDVDNGAVDLLFTITAGPTDGVIKRLGVPVTSFTQDDIDNLRISYEHSGGSGTTDTFDFDLTDGTGSGTVSATFTIDILPAGIVLSEFRPSGPGGGLDEFVEIFNSGPASVDLTGWKLALTSGINLDYYVFPSVSLAPGQHYLVAHVGSPLAGTSDGTYAAISYGVWGDVVLKNASDTIIDVFGYDSSGSRPILYEGTAAPDYAGGFFNRSYERLAGGISGSCVDTDDNSVDWIFIAPPSDPQSMADPFTSCDGAGMVISEFSNVGAYQSQDFIELYNGSVTPIDIEGWVLEVADDESLTHSITLTGPNTVIPAGGHYLLAETGTTGADQTFSPDLTDSLGIRIRDGGTTIDLVGTRERSHAGNVDAALWADGTGLPPLVDESNYTQSWERLAAHGYGNCTDTDDNSADFRRNFTPAQVNPQSSSDPAEPCGNPPDPVAPAHLVISEYRTDGPGGGSDEFVEIFNPTGTPISLAGLELRQTGGSTEYTFPAVMLAPGQYYLVGGSSYVGPVDGTHGGFSNGDGVELYDTVGLIVVDDVGIGTAAPELPELDGRMEQSYGRRFDGCLDTDVWLDDFEHLGLPTPLTSSDPVHLCP